jgi:transposase
MRFVPVKTAQMQAVLALHRARQGLVKARTAQANQIRGLLAEFGIVVRTGIGHVSKALPEILEDGDNGLPGMMRPLLAGLGSQLKELDRQVTELERQITGWHRDNAQSRKLEEIPGIGPLTASAYVASVGDAKNFKSARQVPAWLGMVPRHEGTGGKVTLGRISKRGDTYLRTLLIHGARSVIAQCERKTAQSDPWLRPCWHGATRTSQR